MKRKIIVVTSLAALILICFIFNHLFLYGFYENKLSISYPSKICLTKQNSALVVDSGGKRVIRLGINGGYSLKILSGKNTFHNATDVTEGAGGDIYITDVVWANNGMDIVRESILQFDKYGKLKKSVLNREYEAKTPRPKIFGTFMVDGKLCAVETTNDGFSLLNIEKNETIKSVKYKDAELRISSFAVNESHVIFVDKQGIVYEALDDEIKIRYTGTDTDFSVPWQVTIDNDNNLYVTDIGKREIIKISPDNQISTVFLPGEGLGEQTSLAETPIYYPIAVDEKGNMGTLYFDNIFIKDTDGNVLQNRSEFTIDGSAWLLKILWIAVMGGMAILLIYLLLLIGINLTGITIWKLSTKLGAVIVFVIITMMIIILPITYSQGKNMYIESSMEHLSSVVDIGGKFLDTVALSKIKSPRDYMNDDYISLLNSIKQVVNKDAKHSQRLYCLLYQIKDDILYTPIFLDGTGGTYYPYDYKVQTSTLKEVFEKGNIVETGLSNASSGTWMFVQGPIYDKYQNIVGAIEVGLDMYSFQESYNKMYRQIIFSVISAGIILQMILMQFLGMGDFFKKRRENKKNNMKKDREPIEFIGPLTFLMFFAFNLITAFIPVYSVKLYEPVSGLSTGFMQALPISMNLLAVVGGCVASGTLIHKYGIHKTCNIGGVFAVLPYVALTIASNYYAFTLLFIIAGFGMGMLQNSVYAYIAMIKDTSEQAQGFTLYNSAMFIGFNCGTVIGSLIAEKMGYSMVFIATAIFFLLTAVMISLLMKTNEKIEEHREKSQYKIFRFISNPRIFLFFLCALIPLTLSNHFIFYFMPIYGESLGLGETFIGQLFLINGLCILAFSGILTKLTHENLKDNVTVFIALCIVVISFIIFALSQSLQSIVIILILLGIASSFGASAIRTYYTNQSPAKLYGEGRSMGVFATVENIGDTIGPMVFSFILAGTLRNNYFVTAIVIFVMAIIFLVSSKASKVKDNSTGK